MQELFRWSLITAFVVSLVTFILNFITPSLGVRLLVAILITGGVTFFYMRKHGVPESAFTSGGMIGLAAMVGLLVVMTTDILEYILTLVLFAIAYGLGGLIGKWAVKKPHE